jgi:hypothetical protein
MGAAQLVQEPKRRHPPKRPPYSEGCAWVLIDGAFSPSLIEARAGERLRIVFRREETSPCSEQILLEDFGRSVTLPPFEDVPVELGPLEPGEYEFHCQLGVLRGLIVVGEAPEGSVETPHGNGGVHTDGRAARRSYASSERTGSNPRLPLSVLERRFADMKRPTINITPAERIGRILVGLVGVAAGVILLGSVSGAVVAVLEVLLVLAGLDLIATGALGHCPLYRKLGYTPPSLRGGRHAHPRPS